MKRLKYQKKQKRREKLSYRVPRLILRRTYSTSWDNCDIIYQDPGFHHNHIYKDKSANVAVLSVTRPEFVKSRHQTCIYLMGTTSSTTFVHRFDRIDFHLRDFWKALDLWAKEYKWPTKKPKDTPPLHTLSNSINNMGTQEPSQEALKEAKYMIFYSA